MSEYQNKKSNPCDSIILKWLGRERILLAQGLPRSIECLNDFYWLFVTVLLENFVLSASLLGQLLSWYPWDSKGRWLLSASATIPYLKNIKFLLK